MSDGLSAEGTISAVSSLFIGIELLSWRSVIDVTGDKKVLKRIVKAGKGFERPNEGSVIKGKLQSIQSSCARPIFAHPYMYLSSAQWHISVNTRMERLMKDRGHWRNPSSLSALRVLLQGFVFPLLKCGFIEVEDCLYMLNF